MVHRSPLDVFSFVTTAPNALVATVNHERMLVLLTTDDDHEAWLNGSVEEALALVEPFPPESMRIGRRGKTSGTGLRRPIRPDRENSGFGGNLVS